MRLYVCNRVNARVQQMGYVVPRLDEPDRDTIARMCGDCEDLMQRSASELRSVVLPVLRTASRDKVLIAAVEALARVKGQLQVKGEELAWVKGQLQQHDEGQDSGDWESRPRKRIRQELVD